MRLFPLQAGGTKRFLTQNDLSNVRIFSMAMSAMQSELYVPQAQSQKIPA
jgi:hypothetical protein